MQDMGHFTITTCSQVKTELVLKCLRDPNQSEHPRVVMDRFFVPDQENLMLTPAEMAR